MLDALQHANGCCCPFLLDAGIVLCLLLCVWCLAVVLPINATVSVHQEEASALAWRSSLQAAAATCAVRRTTSLLATQQETGALQEFACLPAPSVPAAWVTLDLTACSHSRGWCLLAGGNLQVCLPTCCALLAATRAASWRPSWQPRNQHREGRRCSWGLGRQRRSRQASRLGPSPSATLTASAWPTSALAAHACGRTWCRCMW